MGKTSLTSFQSSLNEYIQFNNNIDQPKLHKLLRICYQYSELLLLAVIPREIIVYRLTNNTERKIIECQVFEAF